MRGCTLVFDGSRSRVGSYLLGCLLDTCLTDFALQLCDPKSLDNPCTWYHFNPIADFAVDALPARLPNFYEDPTGELHLSAAEISHLLDLLG